MPFVTFIYKFKCDSRKYYGKYFTYEPIDEFDNKLNKYIKDIVIRGLNIHEKELYQPDSFISIGILSISQSTSLSEDNDHCVFDFYYHEKKCYVIYENVYSI
jgi:hypothetical protein